MDKEKIYKNIDKEDDLTDDEKREAYFAEIAEAKDREYWENGYH